MRASSSRAAFVAHAGQGEANRGLVSSTTVRPATARAEAIRPATVDRPLPPEAPRIGTTRRAESGSGGTDSFLPMHPPATCFAPAKAPLMATIMEPTATRNCPHCQQPVTIVALLATPEAARPAMPAGPDVIPLRRTP